MNPSPPQDKIHIIPLICLSGIYPGPQRNHETDLLYSLFRPIHAPQ